MLRPHPRTLLCWLLTLTWAAVIFNFSTEAFGSSTSETILAHTLATIGLAASPPTLDILNSFTRTTAHLTEYAVFGALLYTSLWRNAGPVWRPDVAARSIAIAAAYALTDEFHQRFVTGRHASLLDSSLDTLGAALAMCVIYACSRRLYRNRTELGLNDVVPR